MTANEWTTTKAHGPGNYWNVHDPDGNFVCFAKEPDAKRVVAGLNRLQRLSRIVGDITDDVPCYCRAIAPPGDTIKCGICLATDALADTT